MPRARPHQFRPKWIGTALARTDSIYAATIVVAQKHAPAAGHAQTLGLIIEAEEVAAPEPPPGDTEEFLDAALFGAAHLYDIVPVPGAATAAAGAGKSQLQLATCGHNAEITVFIYRHLSRSETPIGGPYPTR